MIAGVGDIVHGLDVTGFEVVGRVTAVHSVRAVVGPYSSGDVAVLDVFDTAAPLVALVRLLDIKHVERGERS